MTITAGQLTYDAEGTEGGRFHSRKLHVPSATSGLTIGRGYDMKVKTASQIKQELMAAGLDDSEAALLSLSAGLSGDKAKQFIAEHQLRAFEISSEIQYALFMLSYRAMVKDVRRICDKPDCVASYGAVDWDNLNPYIKDVLVDLRYRGDYTPASRKRIQSLVAANDLAQFSQVLATEEYWSGVPKDRFQRRCDFLLQGAHCARLLN